MKQVSLGIDTSCYTTSMVAIDDENQVLFEKRLILKVKEGTVGLRQSDAFFQHVHNLPLLYKACLEVIKPQEIKNLIVSNKPRPIEDSYMPVFMAGLQFADVISRSLEVPMYFLSHQENHLYASAYNKTLPKAFIGVHISGGTSELLKVNFKGSFNVEIIGQTLDISFGKLIDRMGVYMGVAFPCGKYLDQVSFDTTEYKKMKLSIKDGNFNISGIENKLKELYDETHSMALTSKTMFTYIAELLSKVLKDLSIREGIETIVLSGGVSANRTIRKILNEQFKDKLITTDIAYATDHAIGNAYYGSQVIQD